MRRSLEIDFRVRLSERHALCRQLQWESTRQIESLKNPG